MSSIVRIALVGCGRISKNHVNAILKHHKRAQIVAICDPSEERLSLLSDLISERTKELSLDHVLPVKYKDIDLLLSDQHSSIDLCVIATPSGLHSSQVIKASNAGIHVCTEKPMATCWSDGKAMLKACDEAGVKLFVVKQNRFNPTLQLLKKQLDVGRFGRIYMVTSNVFWQRPQSYYDQDAWRGTWEFDGGALMNQASHYVDLLNWLIGPIESVNASIATLGRSIEVEDTATLQTRWRNGALGTMSVTMLTHPKNLEGSVTILGETGSVKIGGPALNRVELWSFDQATEDDQLVQQLDYEVSDVYGNGHQDFYENMLDVIQHSAKPVCDGREGLRSLELLIGAYRSARDRRTVFLPLDY